MLKYNYDRFLKKTVFLNLKKSKKNVNVYMKKEDYYVENRKC